MADRSAWEPLVQMLGKLFPNLSPQILPAAHRTKMILQAIQSGIIKSQGNKQQIQAQCKWCGRAVIGDDGQALDSVQEDKMEMDRILTWELEFAKNILKITGVQFSCKECQLLLDLKRLLSFLITPHVSTDRTKLYLVASHFSQVNGHNSQSGEEDVRLLQQAVAITHSLHVHTKNLTDTTVQGPNGQNITLDSVDSVVESLLRRSTDTTQNHPSRETKKNKKEKSLGKAKISTEETSSLTLSTGNSTSKKKKSYGVVSNGHHVDEEKIGEEEVVYETPKHLKERKKRRSSDGIKQKVSKKRRSLPVMKLD